MGPGKFTGAVTQMLTAPLHYIGASSIFFFRVGLCPYRNYLCRTCGATRGVELDREEERFIDRVDPSPLDHQSTHVLKIRSRAISDLPGDTWTLQERSISIRHTVAISRAFGSPWTRLPLTWRSVELSRASDLHRTDDD